MTLVYDALVALAPDDTYESRLASGYTVSPDATTYTFRLRPNVKWSDGQPFTSKDVAFTFKLLMTPDVSAHAAKLTDVKGRADFVAGKTTEVTGFRTPDTNTFVIELERPNSALISALSWPFIGILPEHVLGQVPPKSLATHQFFLAPTVGLGPFKFVKWETDQYIELDRNPSYWRSVSIDKIFIREMAADVANAALEKGELDIAITNAQDADRLDKLPKVTVDSAPNPGINLISLANDKAPFNDVRVRQALLYAIDRKGIINTVHGGRGTIVNTHMRAPGTVPQGLEAYDYSPTKAKQLLADAKWDPSYVIKMQWIKGVKDRDQTNEIVQANLAAVGVKMELQPYERGPLLDAYRLRTFDATAYGGGIYTIDGDSVTVPIACAQAYPKGTNITHYCNQRVDDLLARARSISDEAEKKRLYQEVAKISNTEVTNLWLNVADTLYARSDRLKGFKPYGDFTQFLLTASSWTLQ
ncbi:MAG TPA: ABC transporter substrate-binding protein [Candidatus Limnocylindria bacterium]|nr:ABC transporter substrate-binding protein [Candidatus Limnocylindria bacterium]